MNVSLSSVFHFFPSCESDHALQSDSVPWSLWLLSAVLREETPILPLCICLISCSHSLFRLPFYCTLSPIASRQSFHPHCYFPSNVALPLSVIAKEVVEVKLTVVRSSSMLFSQCCHCYLCFSQNITPLLFLWVSLLSRTSLDMGIT